LDNEKDSLDLLDVSEEVRPEINAEKTKHISRHQNVEQSHNLMVANT